MSPAPGELLPPDVLEGLERLALVDSNRATGVPVTGGVSSQVWQVESKVGPIAVKQPLARLKVPGKWEAPIERSAWEARWFQAASSRVPGATVEFVGFDAPSGVVATRWLDP